MDRSDIYIKQCKKAEEIQKEWKLNDGDFYVSLRDGVVTKVFILGDWETRNHIAENRSLYVWLPRLDQLQKMIDWTQWELTITKKDVIEMRFAGISGNFGNGAVSGETMEQIWLAFVMKEKYGKVWEPEIMKWKSAPALPS